MAIKLDLTELNKLFDKPTRPRSGPLAPSGVQTAANHAWLDQFYARIHHTESLHTKQRSDSEISPLSSNATLIDEDDDLQHVYKVSMPIEDHFMTPDVRADLQMCSIMSERSKQFVEEIHRRIKHRKAVAVNTDIPSCRSSPSPSSSISSNSFNPNAPAFIPSYALPDRSTPSPSSSASTSINPNAAPFIPSYTPLTDTSTALLPSGITEEPWFPIFWDGVSTNDADARQLHAHALIDSIEWESDSLAVLSQHFCWKAAESTSDGVSSVVLFARVVHDCLRATYGDWYANCFTRHIRECVVGHFKACWKSVSCSFHQIYYRPFSTVVLIFPGTIPIYHIH